MNSIPNVKCKCGKDLELRVIQYPNGWMFVGRLCDCGATIYSYNSEMFEDPEDAENELWNINHGKKKYKEELA